MLAMFDKYGPVVRIAPDELAYADATAWKDIAGHNPKGEENGKWEPFYRPVPDMPRDIISSDRYTHGALRRQLAHGFSDRSMREQEPIIKSYVDLLMQRLKENCNQGQTPQDMAQWFNFTTFDVSKDAVHRNSWRCAKLSFYLTRSFMLTHLCADYWRPCFWRIVWLSPGVELAQLGQDHLQA